MCDRCAGLTFFGLAEPQPPMLDSYAAALRRGYAPGSAGGRQAETHLAEIAVDPAGFLTRLTDQQGTVTMPDGTEKPRLPFRLRWMWDGEFCGAISLRYQSGTSVLPPYVAGHIGYSVVTWKRRNGYASRALGLMLEEARDLRLDRVTLTCAPDNVASRAVIMHNGGVNIGSWSHPTHIAGAHDHYVITL